VEEERAEKTQEVLSPTVHAHDDGDLTAAREGGTKEKSNHICGGARAVPDVRAFMSPLWRRGGGYQVHITKCAHDASGFHLLAQQCQRCEERRDGAPFSASIILFTCCDICQTPTSRRRRRLDEIESEHSVRARRDVVHVGAVGGAHGKSAL